MRALGALKYVYWCSSLDVARQMCTYTMRFYSLRYFFNCSLVVAVACDEVHHGDGDDDDDAAAAGNWQEGNEKMKTKHALCTRLIHLRPPHCRFSQVLCVYTILSINKA